MECKMFLCAKISMKPLVIGREVFLKQYFEIPQHYFVMLQFLHIFIESPQSQFLSYKTILWFLLILNHIEVKNKQL
jgi:hypothetical protein